MTIRHKRSPTAGKVPVPADLVLGQFAINTRDGRVFTKKNDGVTDAVITVGAEMSSAIANALKETSGAAFAQALGIGALDLIEARTPTGAEAIFTGLSAYREVMLIGIGVRASTTATIQMTAGTASGLLTTSIYHHPAGSLAYFALSDSTLSARSFSLTISNFNKTDAVKPVNTGAAAQTSTNWPVALQTSLALDRVRVFPSTGTFAAGTLYVLGRRG